MKLWYGSLVILVLGICIAGCTQPVENLTDNQTGAPLGLGNETPTETPMETMTTETGTATPMETVMANETATMNETTNVTGPGVPPEAPPVTPSETQYTVTIQNGVFNPQTIEVPSGSTVVWTNEGDTNQTVTGLGLEANFDSGLLAPGESFEWMFFTPGAYNYTSQTGGGVQGTVIVGAPGEANQTVQVSQTNQTM